MSVNDKNKVWIPEISDERLAELAERIKPTCRFNGELRYIVPVDPHKVAYMWSPSPMEVAEGLYPLADIRTYHEYGSPNMFKPSIAEVLAQIPDVHLDRAVAFEIVDSPDNTNDLNNELEALNAGYHVATTRLYTKA